VLRAVDLDRLPLRGCDQRASAAAAHPQHVGRLGGVAMSSSMIVFLAWLGYSTADTKSPSWLLSRNNLVFQVLE
jgi:hypothetical protein